MWILTSITSTVPSQKDMADVEMTIQMVDGKHTYKRDWTTQMNAYSPWGQTG